MKKYIIVILLTAIGFCIYVWVQEHRSAVLEFHVFNLKNGNATLIRTPDDRRILINGGSNSEVVRHISRVLPFYSRRVDMVIATNTEKKNVGGLIEVIGRYSVGKVIVPAVTLENLDLASSTDHTYREFLTAVRRMRIPIREVIEGEDFVLNGDSADKKILAKVLFPASSDTFVYSKASAPEIIPLIYYGSTSILMAGNSSKKIQKYLALKESLASSSTIGIIDILIVSNNGNSSNMSREFMEMFKPKILVYSQSLTRPAGTTMFSYDRRFNVKENTVRIVSDGISVQVESGE